MNVLHHNLSTGVPPKDGLAAVYTLHLADNSLIMGHRLSEWAGHGPMLEQDIAISNIALDLIGQARNFYQHAAELINASKALSFGESLDELSLDKVTEDTLAYLRDTGEFKNILLVELPNGDWAKTILKLFFFSTYQYFFYRELNHSFDKQLSAIAEKSLKEVIYHLRWSSEWVMRLGDGTEESHNRTQKALDELWSYTDEMFIPSDHEIQCSQNSIGVNVSLLKNDWDKKVNEVLQEGKLSPPLINEQKVRFGGKQGLHTENLKTLLKEMQYLQRTYPGCEW
ncbi:MAG: 1,2-phenylacetyl-CoA epoxidase subunit PaaC [Ginsengibacter sp.]